MQYLSSAAKGEKIRFAETLLAYQQRAPASSSAPRRSFLGWFTLPYLVPRWGLAVAALVLAAGGYLMLDNLRLRTEIAAERDALQAREQQVQRELNEQRTANAAAVKELAAVRESLARLEERSTAAGRGDRTSVLSFMLLAPRRGVGELTTLVVPRGVQEVRLQLELESVDFPAYQIALRDSAADRILWRSGRLEAPATRARRYLSITIPADLLRQQTYSLEVTGIPARGAADLVASYAFAVVIT